MLRKIRDWYRVFFRIDMVIELARLCAVVLVGTITVILLLVRGELDEVSPVLARVLGAVAFLGFAAWIYYDATRALGKLREQRRKQRQGAFTGNQVEC